MYFQRQYFPSIVNEPHYWSHLDFTSLEVSNALNQIIKINSSKVAKEHYCWWSITGMMGVEKNSICKYQIYKYPYNNFE